MDGWGRESFRGGGLVGWCIIKKEWLERWFMGRGKGDLSNTDVNIFIEFWSRGNV